MPSLRYDGPWHWYLLWNVAGFFLAIVVNSFVEHFSHRWVMHRRCPLLPYGYLHTTSHHATFGADETYHAIRPEMLDHGTHFTWREYVLFPLFCLALYGSVELFTGKPTTVGAMAAVYAGLVAFDLLHYRFHVPSDTWFQRTRLFKFLKDHHKMHHANMSVNLNVVFPLADLCLGTLSKRKVGDAGHAR